MRFVSFIRHERPHGRSYGVVINNGIVDLGARMGFQCPSLLDVLRQDMFAKAQSIAASGNPDTSLDEVTLQPPIPSPEKIICIGVNYFNRNEEYKDESDRPKYPSVFMRTPDSLVGHGANLLRPPESDQFDYEGEISLIIGKGGRRIDPAEAESHIAGISCLNEGSVRDWLRHGKFNVTQGKNFVASGAHGPWMVTADEIDDFDKLTVTTRVNGEQRQHDTTANLLFPFRHLISYLSTFFLLKPGDVIATGTPTGAGARFDPPRYLAPGDTVEVEVGGVGTLSNQVADEAQ